MSPYAPNRTGTRHTDTRRKAEGGEKPAKSSTLNAPSSRHTDKYAVHSKARGILPSIPKPPATIGRSRSELLTWFITCGTKLLIPDWLRQTAFFLNHRGNFSKQEGMIT